MEHLNIRDILFHDTEFQIAKVILHTTVNAVWDYTQKKNSATLLIQSISICARPFDSVK